MVAAFMAECRRLAAGTNYALVILENLTPSRGPRQARGQTRNVIGEPAGTRTQNPCLKGAMLYRLSYRPEMSFPAPRGLPSEDNYT